MYSACVCVYFHACVLLYPAIVSTGIIFLLFFSFQSRDAPFICDYTEAYVVK